MREGLGTTSSKAVSMSRLACMLMTDKPPAGPPNLRASTKGFLGWVLRNEEKLARKMHPELRSGLQIRGAQLASDHLLNAFLSASRHGAFTLAVPNHSLKGFEEWMAMRCPEAGKAPLSICTITQMLGFDTYTSLQAPDVYLDLRGDSQLSVRLRNHTWPSVLPVVSVQHGLSKHTMQYDRYLRLLLSSHYSCDSLVCTSKAAQQALTKIMQSTASTFNERHGTHLQFNGRIDLIPLCIDTDCLKPGDRNDMKKQLGIPVGSVLLLYMGYLSQAKADLTPLLATMLKLIDANPDVDLRLAIAGTGPVEYCAELMSVARELDLISRLTLMREVTDTQKGQLFRAADIFVAPCQSMEESFGLTPIEAMAYGLPQVVADWNGYRDTVIHGETGFLVPTIWGQCESDLRFTGEILGWAFDHKTQGQSIGMDLSRLYDYLQALVRDPELRDKMSELSRARAVACFSYSNIARLYDELWVELAAIAATLKSSFDKRQFDQPAYFDHFGHYATYELRDESILEFGEDNSITLERLAKLAHAELPGIAIIHVSLLALLCQQLRSAASSSKRTRVDELVSQTSHGEWSESLIRRHILFLLKHGKVTVDQFSAPVGVSRSRDRQPCA
jgi:glycosyltransferase involved in cell wall biosynthesis